MQPATRAARKAARVLNQGLAQGPVEQSMGLFASQ
jgi:hypothetical protein